MKYTVAKDDLVKAIGKLQNVVALRPPLPLLANFMIEARPDCLVLTATDLTVAIRSVVPAQVQQTGATSLPAKRFFQLVKELTAPQLQFASDAQEVTRVGAGGSHFKILGMSAAEYPQLPSFHEDSCFQLEQKSLKSALFKTAFAVSKEDSRYALTGVLMQLSADSVLFVGTDGRHLAKTQITLADGKIKGRYILPAKAVDELLRCLEESQTPVKVYVESDKVAFDLQHTLIMTRLISGEYPDFQRVIPQDSKIQVLVHREELAALLRQVMLFTGESNQSARFHLADSQLTISAVSAQVGHCRVAMPLHYQGEAFDIAFSPDYFLDILRHIEEDTVRLELTDSFNPGLICDPSGALFLLMPMRLSDTALVDPSDSQEALQG